METAVTNALKHASDNNQSYSIPNCILLFYEKFILFPLGRLYLLGPTLYGWGFWGGTDISHICASKTHLNSEFWKQNPSQCIQMIGKNFYSIIVGVETIVYFLTLWTLLKLFFYCIKQMKSFLCVKKTSTNWTNWILGPKNKEEMK